MTVITPTYNNITLTGQLITNPSKSFTRPANVTAYASGQLVANSTTAGSVVPTNTTVSRLSTFGFVTIQRVKLFKSGTSTTNASFRVHMFSSLPTVANGDGGALSMSNVAGYLGSVDISTSQAFTDGAAGFSDNTFRNISVCMTTGTDVYALIEARAAYTPANAEVFTVGFDIIQG
jgi:hypothetical protein